MNSNINNNINNNTIMSSVVNQSDNLPIRPLLESDSTEAQRDAEKECHPYFVPLAALPPDQLEHLRQTGLLPHGDGDGDGDEQRLGIQLMRQKHITYLSQVWQRALKAPFVSLDSSRPWMMYWCLHGCDLLGGFPTEQERCAMVGTLQQCWSEYTVSTTTGTTSSSSMNITVTREQDPFYYSDSLSTSSSTSSSSSSEEPLIAGGFGGGPQQMPHAATTYAAVLALCILATGGDCESSELAWDCLTKIRIPMYRWMVSLLNHDTGGYRMHHDGEVDVRASYTILCCAKLLQMDTPYLTQPKVAQFIADCQTFEGGLGGEPWSEAHGGYAFCGVAALKILNKLDVLDLDALMGWLARRQMSFEGGFSGRSNKLVDGCYSFWQGGAMAITSAMYNKNNNNNNNNNNQSDTTDPWLTTEDRPPFPLLFDAPMLERYILLCAQDIHGGLRDKPSKSRDFYHSCYNLSGLSVAQHCDTSGEMYGDAQQAIVHRTHPCYNIRTERAKAILERKW
jgi:protein farnesyltransferase subunit beta